MEDMTKDSIQMFPIVSVPTFFIASSELLRGDQRQLEDNKIMVISFSSPHCAISFFQYYSTEICYRFAKDENKLIAKFCLSV